MSRYGKQNYFCPNCGKAQYDDRINHSNPKSLMCSDKCRDEWELKYARLILGKNAEPAI